MSEPPSSGPAGSLPASVRAWLRASRPASQSYIAPPLLLGQLLASGTPSRLDLGVLLWVQLFGVFDQLFIVYGNDYADRETDAHNRTRTAFSGGSGVLSDGALTPRQLLGASRAAALATLACAAVLTLAFGRPWSLPLGGLALAMLWAYSFPPLQLSYRGGGELLQMLGVGLCLPLFGYYNQAGSLSGFPVALLGVLLPTHLACAMATSLPDEPSDRASGKRSATVWLGARRARALIVLLQALSVAALWHTLPALGATSPGARAALMALPLLGTLATAVGPVGAPGGRLIELRVALGVITTLSLMLGLVALASGAL